MIKSGILLVAYGLGTWQAEQSFSHFCKEAAQTFAPLGVRHAFTSERSRTRLAVKGRKSDSVAKALEKMIFEKYTHIYIQSLHLISGIEYKELLKTVKNMMNTYPVFIRVAPPLLQEESFYTDIVHALAHRLDSVAIHQAKKDKTALVYMAHGTKKAKSEAFAPNDDIHKSEENIAQEVYSSQEQVNSIEQIQKKKNFSADALYVQLGKALHSFDERVFLSCMKGSLTFENLVPILKERDYTHIQLFPLLSLIGSHATEDMAGDSDSSWKSKFENLGFTCEAHCVSLLQTPEFIQLWLRSITRLIDEYSHT